MTTDPAVRLRALGLELPTPAAPVANYVPYKLVRQVPGGSQLLYTSGMIPLANGVPLYLGKLGAEVSLEQGVECARQCVLNALAWVVDALGGASAEISPLTRIEAVVQVRRFVACTPDFHDHPRVLNGASDLLVEIFGDAGRHTRAAVGCPSLPLNVPVEIDFLFSVTQ